MYTDPSNGAAGVTPSVALEGVPRDDARPNEIRNRFRYIDTFAGLGPDEMRTLAETKRFLECHQGDREFRAAVEAGGRFTGEQRRMLKDIGIRFEPEAMAPLWLQPDIPDRIEAMVGRYATFEDLPSDIHAFLEPYPELRTWLRWRFGCSKRRMIQKLTSTFTPTLSPEFTAWRNRRIVAARNELGNYGWALDHPCFAVEVSVGCSVGCGFCAFDAQRLESVFDLARAENRELMAGVASGMVRVLGWPAAHGLLYWNTEPHDNPHYVKLLAFWEELTGAKLCTSTARAGEGWIRELVAYYRDGPNGPLPWPRVSVLTRGIMRRLHRTFSPEELRDVTLLMQQKDSEAYRSKVPSGRKQMLRQLAGIKDLRDVDFENLPEGFETPQGSVACVSGLLVNMVDRSVKLISPCYTTLEYPYGYRVYDETAFSGPEDFEVVLKRVIARSMTAKPYPEMPVRWRDDLKAVPRTDGFTLLSPTTRRDFRRGDLHRRVAELVGRGDMTFGRAVKVLADIPGIGPMTASVMLNTLFEKGYLCEVAITRDYRARREAGDASLRETEAMAA